MDAAAQKKQQLIESGKRKSEVMKALTQITKLLRQKDFSGAITIIQKMGFTPEDLEKIASY